MSESKARCKTHCMVWRVYADRLTRSCSHCAYREEVIEMTGDNTVMTDQQRAAQSQNAHRRFCTRRRAW